MKKLKMNLIKLKNQKKTKLVYDTDKYINDFRKFKTIRAFGEDIYESKITLKESDEDQSDLTNEINKFIKEKKPKNVYQK